MNPQTRLEDDLTETSLEGQLCHGNVYVASCWTVNEASLFPTIRSPVEPWGHRGLKTNNNAELEADANLSSHLNPGQEFAMSQTTTINNDTHLQSRNPVFRLGTLWMAKILPSFMFSPGLA